MPSTHLKRHWPALLLFPAVLCLFWPVLLRPASVLYPTFSPFSDLMVIHWPKAHLMAQTWQAGEGLPHWTPLILSGMPLAANQLAMLAYPPAWLFLIWPIEPVFNLLFIFHLLLGGIGLYLLLVRAHRLSPAAALLGALTFSLNGKWLAHAAGGHVSLVGAVGWMPWTLFGLLMLLQAQPPAGVRAGTLTRATPSWPWAILVAVSLAMQILTHTLPVIYSAYLLAAAVAWHFFFTPAGRWAGLKRLWLLLLLIPLAAGLLGAAQLLPLLELAQYSNRALSLDQAAEFSLSPGQLLLGLFLPSGQGGHELVIYPGLAALLLAAIGLARRRPWTWFYGLLFVFAALFALGPATPLHRLFYELVPGFAWVRTPARIFFAGGLAVAVLAGFGADRLAQERWSPGGQKWFSRLVVALAALALLLGLGLAVGSGQFSRGPLALAVFIPAGLILALMRVLRLLPARPALALLGLVLFLDLASFDLSLLRFVPVEQALAPGRPAAEYLAQKKISTSGDEHLALFRVYSPSYSLPMQTAAAAGLALADGVEPVHLAGYDRYMARAGGYGDDSFSVTIPNFGQQPLEIALAEVQPDLRLLGLLNVEYIAAAFPVTHPDLVLETNIDGVYIYRNPQALPRAWVAHRAVPLAGDWLAQLKTLPEPAAVAAIAGRPQLDPGSTRPGSSARVTRYTPDLIEVETDIPMPGWLVLSEIWYPGWQATVDGGSRPIERANGLLRAVYLDEPGQHRVVLSYRPATAVWGNRLSGFAAGLLLLLLGLARSRLFSGRFGQ